MAHAGQELHGPNGIVLTFIRIEPDVLEMEARYTGRGGLPPNHLHPHQAETFTVLEGAMRTVIGGDERRYGAGETFAVPPNTPHQMAAADGPARVNWQVRPALRTAEFFETLYTGKATDTFLDDFADEYRPVTT